MTDATKATILLGSLILAALGGAAFGIRQSRAKAAALHQAAVFEGEAHAAQQSETQAKADRASAQQLVSQRDDEVAHLRAQLAAHPTPQPAEPVPPDAPATAVVAGLQSLGLHPQVLGEGLAMNLPDGRTTLAWGREFLRVPGLTARIGTLEILSATQAQQYEAQRQQQAATDRALTSADARADAQAHRAEALQRAIDLTPRARPWAPGVLWGVDSTGARHLGAYLAGSWGPVQGQIIYINRTAAIGAGIRF